MPERETARAATTPTVAAGQSPTAPETNGTGAYELEGVRVSLGGRELLHGLDLRVREGAFLGILGPNGSGKTTLLRTLIGRLAPAAGVVRLAGRPLDEYDRREVARRVGVVPQTFTLDFRFTVAEVVALGRYAYWPGLSHSRAGDEAPVRAALERLSLVELADRPVTELSGGERQRVLIAQTLAQETDILLLDEPLNNLDLNPQLEVMELLRSLHAEGRTVVVVLHDINMAAQYCDEVVVMGEGQVAAQGPPADVITPELVLEVFETRVAVHKEGGRPYVTPLGVALGPAAGAAGHRVHVITGGGAGGVLLDELVHRGFSPSVGIVSVFDSDFEAAQRYGLTVVSTPPFQPLEADAVTEQRALVRHAASVVVAPQVYGAGNLANLEAAAEALGAGKNVFLVEAPPIAERDLADGRATRLTEELVAGGARVVQDARAAGDALARCCARD